MLINQQDATAPFLDRTSPQTLCPADVSEGSRVSKWSVSKNRN